MRLPFDKPNDVPIAMIVIVAFALLLAKCTVEAGTEPINVNTTNGHIKETSSSVGSTPKPFDFSDVKVIGLGSSGVGTVTSITATAPIIVTPSPITSTGVISINSAVFEVPLTFSQSITRTVNDVKLTNDSASPGNSKYYGTNSGGTRGYFALPGAGSTSPLTTKGDLWGYTTIDARVPVGANGKILEADSAQTSGVGYSTADFDANTHKINNITDPTSAQDAATKAYVDAHTVQGTGLDTTIQGYRLLGSGIFAQTLGMNLIDITNSISMSDGRIYWVAVYLPSAQTLTGVKWYQSVQGNYTADNNNRIGLYSYSAGTLTSVASCANDGNLWKSGGTGAVINKAFSSTYAAPAGIYFVALIYNSSAQTTAPALGSNGNNIATAVGALDFTNSALIQGQISSQTDLPSPTQAISGVTGSSSFIPWVAIY